MRIAFWRGKAPLALAHHAEQAASVMASRVTHRTFLKALLATVGGAGLAQLASPPQDAEASYIPGSPADVVDTSLTVQGSLTVSPSGQGSLTVGNTPQMGRLNVAGDVYVGGSKAIDASGVVMESYYAQ